MDLKHHMVWADIRRGHTFDFWVCFENLTKSINQDVCWVLAVAVVQSIPPERDHSDIIAFLSLHQLLQGLSVKSVTHTKRYCTIKRRSKTKPETGRIPNSPFPDCPDNTDGGNDDNKEDTAEDNGTNHPTLQPITFRVVWGALARVAVDQVNAHIGIDAGVSGAVIHVTITVQTLEPHRAVAHIVPVEPLCSQGAVACVWWVLGCQSKNKSNGSVVCYILSTRWLLSCMPVLNIWMVFVNIVCK